MSRTSLLLVIVLCLVAAACTGADDGSVTETAEPATTVAPSTVPSDGSSPDSSEPPGHDAADAATGTSPESHLAWFVSEVAQPDIDAAEYEDRFAQVFRDQVPLEQFTAILEDLSTLAPYTTGEIEVVGPQLVGQLTGSDGTGLIVTLSVDTDGRMDGLLVQPGEPPELEDPPATLDEVGQRLQAIGTTTFLAADVQQAGDQVECVSLASVGGDTAAPIGSAFKLYVLGALADAVEAGTLRWDDELTITAELKSLPSGVLQQREDGSTVTVQEAAELMISISDNTATDVLIDAVGRESVEAAQAAYGHADPSLNTPFMTTRELFALKTADPALQDAFLTGDDEAQRSILADLASVPLADIPVEAFLDDPVRPDELEWFASPADLCRALVLLMDRAEDAGLAPVAEILTANPGAPDEDERWARVAFKGGSEPGLITLAWLLEDADGRRFAITGSVVDPEEAFDPGEAILLMAEARSLIG